MTTMTFEKALAELEAIVAKLEKEGTSLNDSLALFEKGVKLARFLRTELDKAERKVEILLKDEKGGMKAEEFEAGETEDDPAEGPKKAASGSRKKGDDDIPF
ncbi:MAG TPA: exodeoxyribonuclease VII small subunit [Burkholderiales bacterium]|nr:exodeoxyribonuclease VII small subunit [Burkholderiales bacterium]